MRKKRRGLNPFSLSFLDVMSCGFGAAVLIFMLIKHNTTVQAVQLDSAGTDTLPMQSQIETIEAKVQQLNARAAAVGGEAANIQDQINDTLKTLATIDARQTATDDGELEALQKQLQEKKAALLKEKERGSQLTDIKGDGKRQYLTGLAVEGRRILILFDRSASMIDEELVNIVRGKFLSSSERRKSGKWKWATAILSWLLAHLPADSRFQVIGFNDDLAPLLPNQAWKWVSASETSVQEALRNLNKWAPEDGTDLQSALRKADSLTPAPDAIYLITDGLPTQGASAAKSGLVSGEERIEYFNEAIAELPKGTPVHTILLPTKGDPFAAGAFWHMSAHSGGRFLAPAWDWP